MATTTNGRSLALAPLALVRPSPTFYHVGLTSTDSPARLRILVVEDNEDGAKILATLLRLRGYEVRVALDGQAALREAEHHPPDVILLDIGLPGMDGYEVARRVLERAKGKNPFIVAISGYGTEEDRRRCAEVGIDLHLLKPVDPERLNGLLSRFEKVVLPTQ